MSCNGVVSLGITTTASFRQEEIGNREGPRLIHDIEPVQNHLQELVQGLKRILQGEQIEEFCNHCGEITKRVDRGDELGDEKTVEVGIERMLQAMQLWKDNLKVNEAAFGLCKLQPSKEKLADMVAKNGGHKQIMTYMMLQCISSVESDYTIMEGLLLLRRVVRFAQSGEILQEIVDGLHTMFQKAKCDLCSVSAYAVSIVLDIMNPSACGETLLSSCCRTLWSILTKENYSPRMGTEGVKKVLKIATSFENNKVFQYRCLGILRNVCAFMPPKERAGLDSNEIVQVFARAVALNKNKSKIVEQGLGLLMNLMVGNPRAQQFLVRQEEVIACVVEVAMLQRKEAKFQLQLQAKALPIIEMVSSHREGASRVSMREMEIVWNVMAKVPRADLTAVALILINRYLTPNCREPDAILQTSYRLRYVVQAMTTVPDNLEIQSVGSTILLAIARDSDNCQFVNEASGFSALWEAMVNYPSDDRLVSDCCEALGYVANTLHPDSVNDLHERHASTLLGLLENSSDVEVQMRVMHVLQCFTVFDRENRLFHDTTVTHAISAVMLRYATNQQVNRGACDALQQILKQPGALKEGLDINSISLVVKAMGRFPDDPQLQLHACQALLCLVQEYQKEMIQVDLIDRICELLKNATLFSCSRNISENSELWHAATALLQGLSPRNETTGSDTVSSQTLSTRVSDSSPVGQSIAHSEKAHR